MKKNLLKNQGLGPSRRIVSLWLPTFSTDRIFMQHSQNTYSENIRKKSPCVTIVSKKKRVFVGSNKNSSQNESLTFSNLMDDAPPICIFPFMILSSLLDIKHLCSLLAL